MYLCRFGCILRGSVQSMKARALIKPLLVLAFCHWHTTKAQTISGIVNNYYQVTAINTINNTVTLNTTSGLNNGSKVLLIQMKGAVIDASNASTFGNISSISSAGNYEFNYVCNISGNNVILEYTMLRTYDPTQQVQLVSVPVYNSVTINGTITGAAWDPVAGTGGVVAIEATNTIFLNANIDVSGQGFQGGPLLNYTEPSPYDCSWAISITDYFLSFPTSDQYHTGGKKGEGITAYILNKEYGRGKQANGGGGGNATNTGGGGGSNYGKGGDGGQRTNESTFKCHGTSPGIGGLSLSAYGYTAAQNKIFFGGGGGAGQENNSTGEPGGNGGGVVILNAAVITGSASILANGTSPTNPANTLPSTAGGDGGGGGGAGGTVILNAGLVSGSIPVQVNGANGSDANYNAPDCMGPGGGGGGGVIWVSGSSVPAAITASFTGGNNGVGSVTASISACHGSSNSATPGDAGTTKTGYVAPMSTAPACTILPISALLYFKGNLTDDGAWLTWQMAETDDIVSYQLQSTIDQVNYVTLATINNNGEKNFNYNDQHKTEGTIYYRLMLVFKNGSTSYSQIVALSRHSDGIGIISMHPNPAIDHINIVVAAKKIEEVAVIIYNTCGQKLSSINRSIPAGYSELNIPLSSLPPGTYFLFIKGKDMQAVKRFIKTNYTK